MYTVTLREQIDYDYGLLEQIKLNSYFYLWLKIYSP